MCRESIKNSDSDILANRKVRGGNSTPPGQIPKPLIMIGETKSATFLCAYCGETNHTFVDPSQGSNQKYIEDCQVCCRPNELWVSYDYKTREFLIQAQPSQ